MDLLWTLFLISMSSQMSILRGKSRSANKQSYNERKSQRIHKPINCEIEWIRILRLEKMILGVVRMPGKIRISVENKTWMISVNVKKSFWSLLAERINHALQISYSVI